MVCCRYGNYLLTSPGSREGRKKRKKKKKDKAEDAGLKIVQPEDEEGPATEEEEERLRRPRKKRLRDVDVKRDVDGRYDVSDLLAPANTLTNPNNGRKTEL